MKHNKAPEAMLERFICQHPECLDSKFDTRLGGTERTVIGRQIQLPHGRLDVLMWTKYKGLPTSALHVLELKARQLEEKDVGQVGRYVADVRAVLDRAWKEWGPDIYDKLYDDPDLWNEFGEMLDEWTGSSIIVPILIGTSVSRQVITASKAIKAHIYTWSHNAEANTIRLDLVNDTEAASNVLPDWAKDVHAKMFNLAVEHIEWRRDWEARQAARTAAELEQGNGTAHD
jgi:hypothetical protein